MRHTIKHGAITENKVLRIIFFILGWVFLGLGVAGVVLPLMPGTIFIILSCYFFAKSSNRFRHWLLHNRLFGKVLQHYVDGGTMPLYAKILVAVIIVLSLIVGIFVF